MAGSKANKVAYFEKLKDLLDKYRELETAKKLPGARN
jgi:hypothetical protein